MCRASWSGTEGSSSLDQLSPPPAILLPRSAQPSSALLLQLSLFLRHSSGAISLTRPAHFFPLLSSPTQPNPPPCLSLLHSVFAAFFPFFLFLNIYINIYFTLCRSSFYLNSRFLIPSPAPSPTTSYSPLPRSLSSLSKSAFITLCSAALFCEALTLTVFRVRGQFPVAILGPLLPVQTCLIQIPGCCSLALLSPALPPSSSSVSLPCSLSVSPLSFVYVIFN